MATPFMRFNPRAREGRDLDSSAPPLSQRGFNPRAREGRDFVDSGHSEIQRVSIRAPARGATVWVG